MTLIRTQLAQGTTDSLHQAVDLLDQLHDFLVSIHNNRFQIDALALQALLQDSLGQNSAAMEKLSAALTLAEPGGFIRLFVDLGPQMADLLQQLIKQNIAVEYIGRILAAFKEDEHRAMQDESDPDGPSSHNRFSSSSSNSAFPPGRRHRPLWAGGRIPNSDLHTSQPLVEPLTNRELEILDLLAQRLQNKEIAEKLFISPETVKKHLNNIYGKLNVSSSRQAVEQAEALGILAQQ